MPNVRPGTNLLMDHGILGKLNWLVPRDQRPKVHYIRPCHIILFLMSWMKWCPSRVKRLNVRNPLLRCKGRSSLSSKVAVIVSLNPEIWPYIQTMIFPPCEQFVSLKSWLSHILDLLPDLSLWNGGRKLNAIALKETYPVKPSLSQNGLAVKYVCVSVWSLNQPLVIESGFGRPSYRTEADWFYWPSRQPQTFAGFVFTIFAPHTELVTPTFVLT